MIRPTPLLWLDVFHPSRLANTQDTYLTGDTMHENPAVGRTIALQTRTRKAEIPIGETNHSTVGHRFTLLDGSVVLVGFIRGFHTRRRQLFVQ